MARSSPFEFPLFGAEQTVVDVGNVGSAELVGRAVAGLEDFVEEMG